MSRITYSPIVGQVQSTPWNRHGDDGHESPGLRDLLTFSDGPAPGDRCPMFTSSMIGPKIVACCRCFTVDSITSCYCSMAPLQLPRDIATCSASYRRCHRSAASASSRHIIVPSRDRPGTWATAAASAHPRSNAASFIAPLCPAASLYLIRPDGHVAFRSQPRPAGDLAPVPRPNLRLTLPSPPRPRLGPFDLTLLRRRSA